MRFVAEELDGYGNPSPLAASARFGAPRSRAVRPSPQAIAAFRELVRRLERDGWQGGALVGEEWYAISMSRPADGSVARRPGAG